MYAVLRNEDGKCAVTVLFLKASSSVRLVSNCSTPMLLQQATLKCMRTLKGLAHAAITLSKNKYCYRPLPCIPSPSRLDARAGDDSGWGSRVAVGTPSDPAAWSLYPQNQSNPYIYESSRMFRHGAGYCHPRYDNATAFTVRAVLLQEMTCS